MSPPTRLIAALVIAALGVPDEAGSEVYSSATDLGCWKSMLSLFHKYRDYFKLCEMQQHWAIEYEIDCIKCNNIECPAAQNEVFRLERELVGIMNGYARKLEARLGMINSYLEVSAKNLLFWPTAKAEGAD